MWREPFKTAGFSQGSVSVASVAGGLAEEKGDKAGAPSMSNSGRIGSGPVKCGFVKFEVTCGPRQI